jgi:hypothetical protein
VAKSTQKKDHYGKRGFWCILIEAGESRMKHLKDLKLDPKNARKHGERNIGMLERSLEQYGAARSIVVDEKGQIIAGHGVVEAAANVGIENVRMVEANGNEIIAVVRRGLTKKQKAELALADNRVSELAEWDADVLKALSDDADLGKFWTEKELALLIPGGEVGEGPEPQIERAAELQKIWKTARGQIWEIPSKTVKGKCHRLICGDCTQEKVVSCLFGKRHAVLMNTDPPYGVDYSKLKDGIPRSGFSDHQAHWGDIENDTLIDGKVLQDFLESSIRIAVEHLTETAAFYLWHPMLTQGTFFAAAAAADILIHRQIIWVKPGFVLTRSGMYHWKHELCFYGWRRGHTPPWYGDKSQVSVWEVGRDEDAGQHPTQKPVELFRRPILNHSKAGEVIYEPFAGSGSQFIGAE